MTRPPRAGVTAIQAVMLVLAIVGSLWVGLLAWHPTSRFVLEFKLIFTIPKD